MALYSGNVLYDGNYVNNNISTDPDSSQSTLSTFGVCHIDDSMVDVGYPCDILSGAQIVSLTQSKITYGITA